VEDGIMNSRNRRIGGNTNQAAKGWNLFGRLLLGAAFLFLLAIGSFRFVRGFQYWRRNSNIRCEYVQEVDRLGQQHQRLKDELYKLEHSLLAQERLAREIGYIKPGEVVYKFASEPDQGAGSSP
jgi:cell division protein FtsB